MFFFLYPGLMIDFAHSYLAGMRSLVSKSERRVNALNLNRRKMKGEYWVRISGPEAENDCFDLQRAIKATMNIK
jgi:hypothetical protein